jgi:uncharacterized protein YcbX
MGGEDLDSVELDARGLAGDRWYAVQDGDGHFASGKNTRRFRRRDQVFDYSARTRDGAVVVAGPDGEWKVDDPRLNCSLTDRMETPVMVLPERDVPHQDMGAISLIGTATLDWCANRWDLEADPRRLRVNVVIATSEPFVEETWQGRQIAVGEAELHVVKRAPRCRMIDIDQDGAEAVGRWLKPLAAERDMYLAMYAAVIKPAMIAVGDEVQLR